jgi:Glycosyl transferase family 2
MIDASPAAASATLRQNATIPLMAVDAAKAGDLDAATVEQSVVIYNCAGDRGDGLTGLRDGLAGLALRARALIVTAPAAGRSNSDCERLLIASGLRPSFLGLTVNASNDLAKNTCIAIIDHAPDLRSVAVPDEFRPLALIASYNEIDILPQVVAHFVADGIAVHVLDHWSTDGTFERVCAFAKQTDLVTISRFPPQGRQAHFALSPQLREKARIAALHPDRWVIHADSDQVRCSPWSHISFRRGLFIADRMGFNAIDYTVCEFRPVLGDLAPSEDLKTAMPYFAFGDQPHHFVQIDTWRQDAEHVDLERAAGHRVSFAGQKVFPYKFILKHFSLRGPEHARRKIFGERLPRFSPLERARGWHYHYDHFKYQDRFLWPKDELLKFDELNTRREYLVELISGIGIVRGAAASHRV